jgi:hypothetical protein
LEGLDGDERIDDVLSTALGEAISVAVHVTGRRRNRKPVLQALGADGAVKAFVKVGASRLTAELVRREAKALAAVADAAPQTFRVPRILLLAEWRGLPLLFLEPVERSLWARSPGKIAVCAAAAEISRMGSGVSTMLLASAYWSRTRRRLESLPPSTRKNELESLADALQRRHGDVWLRFGAAHGDWAPWNMSCSSGSLHVWDWERFERDVPFGFDLLHYRLSDRLLRRGWPPARAVAACRADARGVFQRLRAPVVGADALAAAYVLSLTLRHDLDAQLEPAQGFSALRESLTRELCALVESSKMGAR